ncbi:phage holin family protein [soil metagenome]
MLELLIRVLVNAIALVAAVRLVPGAAFSGEWWQLAALAAIFGLVNAYLRPIVKLVSLPLSIVTFGLVGFVINAVMVLVSAAISDNLDLGFTLGGWPPGAIDLDVIIAAFLTSLVISVVSTLLAIVRMATPRI